MTAAEYYDATLPLWETEGHDNARALAALAAVNTSGAYVLDVGCGTGNLFPYLLRQDNSEILGIDVSPAMIRAARERYGAEPRIEVRKCAFEQLTAGGFDAVIAFNSYHHFLSPEAFLRRAAWLLTDNGRLTVAYGYGRTHLNNIVKLLPAGVARELGTLPEEVSLWSERFRMDCYLDSDDFLILSGVKRQTALQTLTDKKAL